MMNNKVKKDCLFFNTPVCALLNAAGCKSCPVFRFDNAEMRAAEENMRILCRNLPENGVDDLINADECLLCKSQKKGRPVCFAQFVLGHMHPLMPPNGNRGEAKAFRRQECDTKFVIPIQLPVCARCRRRISLKANLPLLIWALISAAGFAFTAHESIRKTLAAMFGAAPFVIFLAFVLFGTGMALLAGNLIAFNIEKHMKTHAEEIEKVGCMLKNGWFSLPVGKNKPDFVFTRERLKNGLLTGDGQAELIAAVLQGCRRDAGSENRGNIADAAERVPGENGNASADDADCRTEQKDMP